MKEILLSAAICIAITLIGAFTQRVSGFGFGIVVMIVLPFIFPTFGEATALAGLVSSISTTYIAIKYRKSIKWKLLIWPLLAYVPINYLAIWLVGELDTSVLKLALGAFLVVLSIYFAFFSERMHIKATPLSGMISGGLSGLLGGAFATGGPPMVVYMLSASGDDKTMYIATVQCFFALTGYVSAIGRIANGLVTERVLILLPIAALGMALGNLIGGRVYNKLSPLMLRRLVYAFMAVSGVIIFITSALS